MIQMLVEFNKNQHIRKEEMRLFQAVSRNFLTTKKHFAGFEMYNSFCGEQDYAILNAILKIVSLFYDKNRNEIHHSNVDHKNIERWRDVANCNKNNLLISDKAKVVLLLLFGLSKNHFEKSMLTAKNKAVFQSFDSVTWTAIISDTIHDIPYTQGRDLDVQDLRRIIQRLNLHLTVSLSSPIVTASKLRIKGSAPKEGAKGAISDSNCFVLVFLGWSENKLTRSIEVLNPITQKWSFFDPEPPVQRAYHSVAVLGDTIYIVGGFNGDISLPTTIRLKIGSRKWSLMANMSVPRCYVCTVISGGCIFAIGGHSGITRLRSCEKFDPRNNMWYPVADMIYKRSDAAAAELNGKILVCGGFDGFFIHAKTEIYDPVSNVWSLVGNLINPRSGHSMLNVGGYAFAFGGFNGYARLREVEMFDEENDSWKPFIPMLQGRSNFSAVAFQGEVYVMGGYSDDETISNVEKFNREKMEWQVMPSLNIPRSASSACVTNNYKSNSVCSLKEFAPVSSTNIEEPSP